MKRRKGASWPQPACLWPFPVSTLHELVHLRERHHGPAFWIALGRALPDWRKRKDALAKNAKDHLVFGLIT